MRRTMAVGALAALSMATPALGQDAKEAPICTDRPTKANAVCTVPAGKWQLESSAVDWLRLDQNGTETEGLLIGSSVIKYGVSDRSDLQVGFTPYVRVRGDGDHLSGFGDVTVRYKHRLTGSGSAVQAALIPFVKMPTAKSGIGNGKAEGGLALPISFALVGPVTATLGPEADLVADGDGHGRHLAVVNLINLSASVAPRVTVVGELWSNFNFDPAGTIKQASADLALAYGVSDNVQLDAGANLGLTDETADMELYVGGSIRF